MSWNHTQEYETAGYQDYASRLGGGQYEKVWDLGESPWTSTIGFQIILALECKTQCCACALGRNVTFKWACVFLCKSQGPWRLLNAAQSCAGAEHKFLCDHVVDGRILMPATSYVVTAWEALCSMKSRKMEETPVVFEDVQIRQAVTAEEGQKIALAVLIAPDNRFCVSVHFLPPFLLSSGLIPPKTSLSESFCPWHAAC